MVIRGLLQTYCIISSWLSIAHAGLAAHTQAPGI